MSKQKCIVGKRFGLLLVESFNSYRGPKPFWNCLCDCGNRKVVCQYAMQDKIRPTKSCGCLARKRFQELTGKKFSRLSVLSFSRRGERRESFWNCICDCGNRVEVRATQLTSGRSRSCGCYLREWASEKFTTHGFCKGERIPEYAIWCGIKQRVCDTNHERFSDYGGRGISICSRWLDFPNFLADMGSRPSDLHSIDRIDNNGNYEPTNCRWATDEEQANNKKSNRRFEIGGENLTYAQWGRRVGLRGSAIGERIAAGWTPEEAIMPKRHMRKHTARNGSK